MISNLVGYAMFSFDEIHEAYLFANSGGMIENTAVICRKSGRILYHSDYDELEEYDQAAEEIEANWESDDMIAVPDQNELDLGQKLVFAFAREHLPDDLDYIYQMFNRRGAYGQFKDFLFTKDLLDQWHEFENKREEQALRQWCKENDVVMSG